jgi:mycoredoxin
MYTSRWCADCHRAKRFLLERRVEFEEIDIEEVEGAAEYVAAINQGKRRVPTFEINGRVFHCSPYNPERLIRELGLPSDVDKIGRC